MNKNVGVWILCEDRQQQVFIRHFLISVGYNRRKIRTLALPAGKQCGFQFVQNKFDKELETLRSTHPATLLVVMLDQDGHPKRLKDLQESRDQLKEWFESHPDHRVWIFAPNRTIETWIEAIEREQEISEEDKIRHLLKETQCRFAVKKLVEWCNQGNLPPIMPPSLKVACSEYKTQSQ